MLFCVFSAKHYLLTFHSPDMVTLDWTDKKLTDAELETELQRLKTDVPVKTLILRRNRLTFVPDLTRYKQFRQLKKLCLHENKITTVTVQHIPLSCEDLWLYNNQINVMPDLRPLTRLSRLNLYNNNIQDLPSSHLPSSLTELSISYNRLTDSPDLRLCDRLSKLELGRNNISALTVAHLPPRIESLLLYNMRLREVPDLSPLAKLRYLNLNNNPITSITGLPDSMTYLDIGRVRVRVLGEKCFSDNTYKLLKEKLDTGTLVQPPAEVFHRGLSDVRSYFEQRKTQQVG